MNEVWDEKYGVRLFIKHPNIDPAEITEALRLHPRHAWMVGSAKVTPFGTTLPGKAKISYWNYTEIISGKRDFPETLKKILSTLEKNVELIGKIQSTCGQIEIDLQFFGGAHIGGVIDWDELSRIAKMKINLGIEVFPDWAD